MTSPYQKELAVRSIVQNLVFLMSNDKRVDTKAGYQMIGEMATLGAKLKKERKSKKRRKK